EFGFDYLRDNMTGNPDELVQRKHHYAIVDEVDSVLIDDARTPLIISGPTPKGENQEFDSLKPDVTKLYQAQRSLVSSILAEAKKILSNEPKDAELKKGGDLLFRAYRGLPKNNALIKFLSEEGMRSLMQKTESFYLQEQAKNMHLIDDELFFVIDEKVNSVELTEKGIDLLTEAYNEPHFFILPDIGAEIAELSKLDLPEDKLLEKKGDMIREFTIKSERLHTVHQLLKAYTLFEKDVEYVIIDNKIKIVDEQTGRIMEGRRYSDGLHQAIEAKENVKIEAATQTYATITLQNYFRMYGKLAGMTGTAETEAGELWDIYKLDVVVIPTNKPIVRDDREDLVYKTKREKFNAVIDDIENLVNKRRPVLVGTTSVETSELLSRMLKRKGIEHNVLNAKLHQREAQIVKEAGQAGVVTIATNMAGRGTDIKLGLGVKEAGGLAIIGTERHESRRVDRQLRGRSGRQGDPGSSQFFVSLEDDLMRMFGSGRIAGLMDRLGLKEGEVIQHSMITKSIERAQRKVEENNFGTRKRLLEYDDVMNSQREVIYKKRRHALFGERLSVDISNMLYDLGENLITEGQEARDYNELRMSTIKHMGIEPPFDEDSFLESKADSLNEELFSKATTIYREKSKRIGEKTMPVIRDVFEKQKQYENIAIPITDGHKRMQIVVNLQKAVENGPREVTLSIEKNITLALIDDLWKEHLRELDELKQSVQNATYEQKDPLLIYKLESFQLFKSMVNKINKDVISFLMRADIPIQDPSTVREAQKPRGLDRSKMKEERSDLLSQAHSNTQQQEVTQPIVAEKKVGRNEACPCGSGKKYKNCHGKVAIDG
ncbi:MAG: SEC-C domain-containing protein, partial [Bacteroidetes bacterium]|nr:SEC-C domain-containing protein [Bacteroidota bacterium]